MAAFQRAVTWTGIFVFSYIYLGFNSFPVFLLLTLLTLFPGAGIYSEVYTWASGFENYVPPVFLFLICLVILDYLSKKEKHNVRDLPLYILLSGLALASQFFSENSSLYFFVVSLFLLIATKIKNKKLDLGYLLTTFITLAGFIFMMISPPFFRSPGEEVIAYRSVPDSLASLVTTAFNNYRSFADCLSSCIFLIFAVSFSLVCYIKKNDLKGKIISVSKFIFIFYPIYSIYCAYFYDKFQIPGINLHKIINIILPLAYTLLAAYVALKTIKDKKNSKYFNKGAVIFILAIVSFVPLLVVSPVGGRTFYVTYVSLALSSAVFFYDNIKDIKIRAPVRERVKRAASLVLAFLMIITLSSSVNLKYADNMRSEYLEEELDKGSKNIVIPLLPYNAMIHTNGSRYYWDLYFYYIGEEDINYRFESWDVWFYEKYENDKNARS